jgi:pSer/pThr/pTyr-binding forkhead associated (FHA) protein
MSTQTQINGNIASHYALLVDPHTGQEFNLCRFATSVGRSISCDVVLTDKSVSRQHAIIYCLKGKFFVEDVGSTNGTLLNGKAMTARSELMPGDEVKLGITKLVFLLIPDHSGGSNMVINQDPTYHPEEEPGRLNSNVGALG